MAKPDPPAPPRRTSSTTPSAPPVAATGFAPLVPPGTSAGGTEVVLCADFDRYGTRLVTGGADHRLRMYERVHEHWELVDVWRAHNGMVLDVKFSPLPSSTMPLFASTGEDLRLKIWASDPTAPLSSGRRFYTTFSQSAGHGAVAYVALAFAAPAMPAPDLLLAVVTRDGLLSLLEPVPEVEQRAAAGATGVAGAGASRRQGQDWRELDQLYAADGLVARGTETCFRLAFQPFPTPTTYITNLAATGSPPVSLAVASLNEVRIYPILPPSPYPAANTSSFAASSTGSGSYQFGSPLVILPAGNGRLVRDVAWSPAAHRASAWIAAASADGMVRVYDVASPKGRKSARNASHPSGTGNGNGTDTNGGDPTHPSSGRSLPAPQSTSTLTASLSRAQAQAQAQAQVQAQPSQLGPPVTTTALFPSVPSTADLSGHEVEPAASTAPSPGPLAPRLDARLVAELEHAGVWRVSWVRTGAMVVSMGDAGTGRVWGPGVEGKWIEFAEFGADGEEGGSEG